jgi:hypothetical protein
LIQLKGEEKGVQKCAPFTLLKLTNAAIRRISLLKLNSIHDCGCRAIEGSLSIKKIVPSLHDFGAGWPHSSVSSALYAKGFMLIVK